LFNEAREECDLVLDALWLRKYNVLPCDGGRLDQESRFLQAVEIVESELGKDKKDLKDKWQEQNHKLQ
jgi:hypothetical protein